MGVEQSKWTALVENSITYDSKALKVMPSWAQGYYETFFNRLVEYEKNKEMEPCLYFSCTIAKNESSAIVTRKRFQAFVFAGKATPEGMSYGCWECTDLTAQMDLKPVLQCASAFLPAGHGALLAAELLGKLI